VHEEGMLLESPIKKKEKENETGKKAKGY